MGHSQAFKFRMRTSPLANQLLYARIFPLRMFVTGASLWYVRLNLEPKPCLPVDPRKLPEVQKLSILRHTHTQ